ncbi:unnamed protein product [Parnassius apollo]|uniref:(apollo) hypothetical protein n=1 Tax=Parnassius apollo TaxID=110799 RepID=A0A8S3X4H3_PARAO|nr:unnamed protein product [Parnassius apollo]
MHERVCRNASIARAPVLLWSICVFILKLEEFIDLYRKLPCLWQIKSKEYHIRDKKIAAYQQLVDVLKEIEPDANRESVIRKINTYRTNYRKEQKKVENSKKSGAGINYVYVPSLWYYDKLHFIRDQETTRTSQSNLTKESTEESTIEETEKVETDGVQIYTESSSDAVQSPQASTSSTVVESLHPPTPSRNRSRPTKRISNSDSVTEDVLLSVRDHFKRPAVPEDGCDVFSKMVAIK